MTDMRTRPRSTARASAQRTDDEDRAALGRLAFSLGAKYADRSLGDVEAAEAQWREIGAAGLAAVSLPETHGGGGDMADLCLVVERLGAGGYPAPKLTISTGIAGSIIARHGTPEQQERWLPGIGSGQLRFCFAITEADAGSNSANITTRAERTPQGWRLSGTKTYISAVDASDVLVIVARDVDSGGHSLFALDLPDPRIVLHPVDVHVPVAENQWTLYFDDVTVDDGNLLGRPGGGFQAMFDGLNPERLIVAAQAVGLGRWCLARAADHASRRVVFDVPIGSHQAVAHPLAEAYVGLEAAWGLTERAASAYSDGGQSGLESNVAKIAACDAGLRAADAALQAFGGSGFTGESMLFDRFAYLRLLRSVPVAREMALNHVATAGLHLPRSY